MFGAGDAGKHTDHGSTNRLYKVQEERVIEALFLWGEGEVKGRWKTAALELRQASYVGLQRLRTVAYIPSPGSGLQVTSQVHKPGLGH